MPSTTRLSLGWKPMSTGTAARSPAAPLILIGVTLLLIAMAATLVRTRQQVDRITGGGDGSRTGDRTVGGTPPPTCGCANLAFTRWDDRERLFVPAVPAQIDPSVDHRNPLQREQLGLPRA